MDVPKNHNVLNSLLPLLAEPIKTVLLVRLWFYWNVVMKFIHRNHIIEFPSNIRKRYRLGQCMQSFQLKVGRKNEVINGL
ncbi:hypothetical protein KIN20_028540 [Parelaphostrongylus tenuis]|uniref:Uncharacterized protein n=1 Tax=Parelaphostrongylus tenuis TaxID=148309 RepID=A0AAD5R185_PARTN|nr:hypothetical protein KIN20_028540 [Parelaphostrongylus tenuis]